jgi:hypothetical protein
MINNSTKINKMNNLSHLKSLNIKKIMPHAYFAIWYILHYFGLY